jgi:hypothetical protein
MAAEAIRSNQIVRVVNLSSIGAELDAGVGPINGLHDVEGLLDDAATHITHLRPGFFFENLLWQIDSIRTSGTISLPLSGRQRNPMIATRDISNVAAELLVSQSWMGQCLRELHRPVDLNFDEVAGILSEALDRKVAYVPCDRQQARQAIIASGLSENAADLMMEMYEAVDVGRLRPMQPRSAETTTPTTLAEFAREGADCVPRSRFGLVFDRANCTITGRMACWIVFVEDTILHGSATKAVWPFSTTRRPAAIQSPSPAAVLVSTTRGFVRQGRQ